MLELVGLLQVTGEGGESIDVSGDGNRLRAEIGALTVRKRTLRLYCSSYILLGRLAKVLARRNLTLLVTRSGEPLVEVGAAVEGGFAERLLRLPRVKLYRRI